MKTSRIDTLALKAKHRLERVMQEAGETFEADAGTAEQWRSTSTPGLCVDLRRQIYELRREGAAVETGDVIEWLRRRYGWTFGQAVKFLERRIADPAPAAVPASPPKAAALAVSTETVVLDKLQRRALEIGGERIRHLLSWSWLDLQRYVPETRVQAVSAPQVTECESCGERIGWLLDTSTTYDNAAGRFRVRYYDEIPAFAITRRLDVDELASELPKYIAGAPPILLERLRELLQSYSSEASVEGLRHVPASDVSDAFVGGLRELLADYVSGVLVDGLRELLRDHVSGVFVEVEEEGLVCLECAQAEKEFQIGVALCKKSALQREDAIWQEKQVSLRESWEEAERERLRQREEEWARGQLAMEEEAWQKEKERT
jgi:hypothetical protein